MNQHKMIATFLALALFAATVLLLFADGQAGQTKEAAYVSVLEQETENNDKTKEQIEEKTAIPATSESGGDVADSEVSESATEELNQTICVFVCGSVCHAGTFELSEGARIGDFIEAAGGFSKKADQEYLNLAEVAEDGQQIYVPSKKETKKARKETIQQGQSGDAGQTGGDNSSLVNINTADKQELMTLPGIGESKADAIIAYREEKGGFASTEELMQITGIKEGVYSKICEKITV